MVILATARLRTGNICSVKHSVATVDELDGFYREISSLDPPKLTDASMAAPVPIFDHF
jgi:hypothetical protein